MDDKSLLFEVIAVLGSVAAGVWAVTKAVLSMRSNLDKRIDKLERTCVTRDEFSRSIQNVREEMRADLMRIDNKLEAMNGNIMLLVHTLGEIKKS